MELRRGSRILVRGAQWSFDPKRGALSPTFAQNKGFPSNLPENCMTFEKKNLGGKGGPSPPGPPGSATDLLLVGITCEQTALSPLVSVNRNYACLNSAEMILLGFRFREVGNLQGR